MGAESVHAQGRVCTMLYARVIYPARVCRRAAPCARSALQPRAEPWSLAPGPAPLVGPVGRSWPRARPRGRQTPLMAHGAPAHRYPDCPADWPVAPHARPLPTPVLLDVLSLVSFCPAKSASAAAEAEPE